MPCHVLHGDLILVVFFDEVFGYNGQVRRNFFRIFSANQQGKDGVKGAEGDVCLILCVYHGVFQYDLQKFKIANLKQLMGIWLDIVFPEKRRYTVSVKTEPVMLIFRFHGK